MPIKHQILIMQICHYCIIRLTSKVCSFNKPSVYMHQSFNRSMYMPAHASMHHRNPLLKKAKILTLQRVSHPRQYSNIISSKQE